MKFQNRLRSPFCFVLLLLFTVGCSPKAGSEAWCKKMDEKPKGDWTANEAGEYAKSCLLKSSEKN